MERSAGTIVGRTTDDKQDNCYAETDKRWLPMSSGIVVHQMPYSSPKVEHSKVMNIEVDSAENDMARSKSRSDASLH